LGAFKKFTIHVLCVVLVVPFFFQFENSDSGAGAGQSTSLIVGLGTYTGGELMVEGEKKDIRYKAIEFNGWKQRHWTLPFHGERFSLVWFTPKGCEGVRGIDLCK